MAVIQSVSKEIVYIIFEHFQSNTIIRPFWGFNNKKGVLCVGNVQFSSHLKKSATYIKSRARSGFAFFLRFFFHFEKKKLFPGSNKVFKIPKM